MVRYLMTDPDPKPQLDKFKDLARELECDDDEEAFKAAVRKIGTAPRTPPATSPPGKDET
jgi:hypothetical protein